MAEGGRYARLYEAQASAFKDDAVPMAAS